MAGVGDFISRFFSGGSAQRGGEAAAGTFVRDDVQAFIEALHALEDHGTLDPLLSLFADDVELINPNVELHAGLEAARRFWTTYRRSFGDIHSHFRHVVADGACAILEWTSSGHTTDGSDFAYDGVSVLEFQNGRIQRFKAYFDPADLGDQLAPGSLRHRGRKEQRSIPGTH